jgi:hypothetical protein
MPMFSSMRSQEKVGPLAVARALLGYLDYPDALAIGFRAMATAAATNNENKCVILSIYKRLMCMYADLSSLKTRRLVSPLVRWTSSGRTQSFS